MRNKNNHDAGLANEQFNRTVGADIKTSSFKRQFNITTAFNTGLAVPIRLQEILPGDIFDESEHALVRSSTPITPVMDNAFVDTYTFFVPKRLLWDKWKEFQGENKDDKWNTTPSDFTIPQIEVPNGGWDTGSVADFLAMQIDKKTESVSALPFRAYALIWNEWFRNQNTQDPALFTDDSATQRGVQASIGNPIANAVKGGALLPLNKYKDYFTSCLPSPQKAADVLLPILGLAPVTPVNGRTHTPAIMAGLKSTFSRVDTGQTEGSNSLLSINGGNLGQGNASGGSAGQSSDIISPNNLFADLSKATSATINQVRLSFALQQMYELDARGGTRYTEKLLSAFGVHAPDASLQRPELLGSTHTPVNIQQVPQTSSTNQTTPQGNVSAFSLTGVKGGFKKSFHEHGYLITIAGVRTNQTYSQGIHKLWTRKTRTDFYEPMFDSIGEQPVLNKEIFADGSANDNKVFGYQEAWAEYRYEPDRVTGAMRPNAKKSLAIWNYANNFATVPVLDTQFTQETIANVDRTLAVKAATADQWLCDFLFKQDATRCMPIQSIPGGLVDRN